jgi:hypothetical protein
MALLECPSISLTILSCTPFVSSRVAQVCLSSWKRTSGRPARRTSGSKCREQRFSPGSAYRLTSSPTTTDKTSSLMSKLA